MYLLHSLFSHYVPLSFLVTNLLALEIGRMILSHLHTHHAYNFAAYRT